VSLMPETAVCDCVYEIGRLWEDILMGMQEYAPQLRPDLFEGHYATMRDQRWPERAWEQESVDWIYGS